MKGERQEMRFTEAEVIRLFASFQSISDSKDGRVAISDLVNSRSELRENPLTIKVLSVFDRNADGRVSFSEFVLGLSQITNDEESKIRFLFEVYDLDKDGFISNSDLFHVVKLMAREVPPEHLQQLVDRTVRDCDKDMDGKLCFQEFRSAISRIHLGQQLDIDI